LNIHLLYHAFARIFRPRRMRRFQERFRVTAQTCVLDVGGTPFNWSFLRRPPKLIIINLLPPDNAECILETWVVADGRRLPFKSNSFDIVYSNSLIEHLGSFENQRLFAEECRRVGLSYYVQTPNKRFPIEPHLITPFIHWLPVAVQRRLLRNFTVRGLIIRPTDQECEDFVRGLRLLNEPELQQLFPDAKIWHECVVGLVKSLIACRIVSQEETLGSRDL
jgi:hypothetical protein